MEAYREDIARMYQHYKQHKDDYGSNCNDVYYKTHDRSYLNRMRYLYLKFTTCSVCGRCGYGGMSYDIEVLMWQKEIQELTQEWNNSKAQALGLPLDHQASE